MRCILRWKLLQVVSLFMTLFTFHSQIYAGDIKALIYNGMQIPGQAPGVVFRNLDFNTSGISISKKGAFGYPIFTNLTTNNRSFVYYNPSVGLSLINTNHLLEGYDQALNRNGYDVTYYSNLLISNNQLVTTNGTQTLVLAQLGQTVSGSIGGTTNYIAGSDLKYNSFGYQLYDHTTTGTYVQLFNPNGALIASYPSTTPLIDSVNPSLATSSASRGFYYSPSQYSANSSSPTRNWFIDGSNVHQLPLNPLTLNPYQLKSVDLTNHRLILSAGTTQPGNQTLYQEFSYDFSNRALTPKTEINLQSVIGSTILSNPTLPIYQAANGTHYFQYNQISTQFNSSILGYQLDGSYKVLLDSTRVASQITGVEYYFLDLANNPLLSNEPMALFQYRPIGITDRFSGIAAMKADGSIIDIMKTSDFIDLGNGGPLKSIANFAANDDYAYLDENNRVYFTVNFTDGTNALLYSDVLAIPEPGTTAVALVSGVLGGWIFLRKRQQRNSCQQTAI